MRLARPLPPSEEPGDNLLRHLGTLALDTVPGLSGMHVADDLTLRAVSDFGRWFRARLVLDPSGVPLGLEDGAIGWLRDPAGATLPSRHAGDAESLAPIPGGGWLVGFERAHRIWRYRTLDGRAEPVAGPPGLDRAPFNGGLEALAVLADGRWLALTERLWPEGGAWHDRVGWIGGPGRWHRFAYRCERGYDASDACALPDGGALVLERRFTWAEGFTARVRHLPPPVAAAPVLMEPTTIAALHAPLPSDNWEAISAFRHGGRLLVAILSDDNGTPLQRALLSVFVWPGR